MMKQLTQLQHAQVLTLTVICYTLVTSKRIQNKHLSGFYIAIHSGTAELHFVFDA